MDTAFGSVGVDAGRIEDEVGREDDSGSARIFNRVSISGVAAVGLLADAIPHGKAEGLVVDS